MQQKISSSDKDFDAVFTHMIVLDAYMMLRIYRDESGAPYLPSHYPKPNSQSFKNLQQDFKENFLDAVFGDESNLTRGEFILKVSSPTNRWVFESEYFRIKWNKLCEHLEGTNPQP